MIVSFLFAGLFGIRGIREFFILTSKFQYPRNHLQVILHYAIEWFHINRNSSSCGEKQEVILHWLKPPRNVFKLNVDGA